MDFQLSPYNHHWTAFITQPLIKMSNLDDLKSIFEDPSDIEMKDLAKPKHTFKLSQSFWSLKSTWCKQCPIMALPIDPQPTPMVPTVVSEPTLNDIAIAPLIPTNLLSPPHLRPQRPFHLGEDIMAVRRGTHFVRVEEWDHDHYWITCQMDYTQELSSQFESTKI